MAIQDGRKAVREVLFGRIGLWVVFGSIFTFNLLLAALILWGEVSTVISAPSPITIHVNRGDSLSLLLHRLSREGRLSSRTTTRLLGMLRGDSGRIKAGDFVLKGEISAGELLNVVVTGRAKYLSLVVPEGFAIRDIVSRLNALEPGKGAEFQRLTSDPAFLASLNLPFPPPQPNLEGYIYPDTYYLHRGADMANLITLMVNSFREKVEPMLRMQSGRVNLSPYQVMVLASIIEKETGLGSERKLISGVFHNRLKRNMQLGSDPTVIYGIKDFNGNLTRRDLRTTTPYNTYKIRGLPPTPIASPGFDSIEAALDPARVRYLYFVARGDGSHFFSNDLKTHERAVDKYQRRPHRRGKR